MICVNYPIDVGRAGVAPPHLGKAPVKVIRRADAGHVKVGGTVVDLPQIQAIKNG